jgi:predicted alpha/beta hydrolase
MIEFFINNIDQHPLAVYRFDPKQPNGKVILICSATAVKQEFYANYATYLSEVGYTVYTFDYSGIGKSKPNKLKSFEASMRSWAQKDFYAITQHLNEQHPQSDKFLIGHSIGGIFIGLTPAYKSYKAFVTIASQFGYWKYFEPINRPIVLWLFAVLIPICCKLIGYFPSKIKSLGEPLPKGAALDWQTLIMNPDSALALARQSENHYAEIRQPMLMIGIEDDWMARKKTVDLLAQKVFVNAKVTRRQILVSESDSKSIGHMDFFRRKNKEKLWKIPLEWIEA